MTTAEWKRLGNTKYNEGRYAEALELYTKALQIDPNDKVLHGNRGQTYFKLNRFHEAIADSLRSTKIDPSFSKGYFRTGTAYLKLGLLNESEHQYTLAMQLGEASASRNVAEVVGLREDWCGALGRRGGHGGPPLERTLDWVVAQTLAKQGRFKDCVSRMRKLALAASHNLEMKRFFVEACAMAKNWDDLVLVLKDVMDDPLFGMDITVRYYGALAHYSIACFEECLRYLDVVVQMDPRFKETPFLRQKCKDLIQYVQEGKAYMSKIQYNWSYEAFTKALGVDPHVPCIQKYLYACRAVPLMNLSRFDEAIKDCGRALEDNHYEWRAKALECRAFCYESRNEIQLALEDYEKANEVSPSTELEQRILNLRQMRPKRKDYYAILGLNRDSDNTQIKSAYRQLALKYHPDRQALATEDEGRVMKVRFQEISEAYVVLSDKDKRARYDAGEAVETLDTPEPRDPIILFNMVCGALPPNATLCQTVIHQAKQCCFWAGCCFVGSVTCPCWCPVVCCRTEKLCGKHK